MNKCLLNSLYSLLVFAGTLISYITFFYCSQIEKSDYVWAQTENDVTLWFRLPEDSKKSDFIVDVSCNDVHIEFKKQVMLDGKLFEAVKVDETVWTLESGK